MADKISFIALSTTGTPIRRITVTRSYLRVFVVLLMLGCVGAGWLVYDYTQVKFTQEDNQALLLELNSKQEEIATQRNQIKNFAEQINKQLNKLINVRKLHDLTGTGHVEREMALIKVNAKGNHRAEVLRIVDIFRCKVVDVSPNHFTIEVTGTDEKLGAILSLLKPMGIKEIARTGAIALPRVGK